MKKLGLFIAVVILLVLSGCVTQKRCNLKFPPQVTTIVKDSIVYKETTVYKDTTIYIKLVADTIIDSTFVTINKGLVNSKTVKVKGIYADATGQVINSVLIVKLFEKDTTLQLKLDNAIRETNSWKEKYNSIISKEVKTTNHMNLFQKIFFYIGLIVTLMGIGYIVFKFILKKGF